MNTKKDIVDKTYYILGEDQTSTVFDKEGTVVPKINTTIDQICRCNVTNILTGQKIRGWILDFLYEEKTIKIPKAKKTMSAIDKDASYIELDTIDGLPVTWFVEIEGNVISYNGLDAINNRILKVGSVNWPHEANSYVHFAYVLPEGIIKAADFFDIVYGEPLKFVDFREKRHYYERCYTLKPYKWRKAAIFYDIDTSVRLTYTKKIEPLSRDEDECWLPDDYGIKIVPYIVAGQLLIDTSEVSKWERLLAIWYAELEDMYSFYATPAKQFRKKIKTTPLDHNLW